jgi:hypothetical protein
MNDKLIKLKNDLFEPKKFFTKKNNQFHYADLYSKYLEQSELIDKMKFESQNIKIKANECI